MALGGFLGLKRFRRLVTKALDSQDEVNKSTIDSMALQSEVLTRQAETITHNAHALNRLAERVRLLEARQPFTPKIVH